MVDVDDEYARKHMAGQGDVLFFDKQTMPRWMRLLIAAPLFGAGAVVVGALFTGNPDAFLAVPLLGAGALLELAFWTLRTTVSQRFVHIQYGLVGPKIDADDIVSAVVVTYDWKQYGGFGVRRSKGTTAYNMMGDQGRAVKLTWRDGNKTQTLLVSARDPQRLCDAIEQARRGARTDASFEARADALADARADVGLHDAPEQDSDQSEHDVEQPLPVGPRRLG